MIRDLLTFPARATARAAWAFVSTEPVLTILFGAEEPFDEESGYTPGMTLSLPYEEELATQLRDHVGDPASVVVDPVNVRLVINGREVARRVQEGLA